MGISLRDFLDAGSPSSATATAPKPTGLSKEDFLSAGEDTRSDASTVQATGTARTGIPGDIDLGAPPRLSAPQGAASRVRNLSSLTFPAPPTPAPRLQASAPVAPAPVASTDQPTSAALTAVARMQTKGQTPSVVATEPSEPGKPEATVTVGHPLHGMAQIVPNLGKDDLDKLMASKRLDENVAARIALTSAPAGYSHQGPPMTFGDLATHTFLNAMASPFIGAVGDQDTEAKMAEYASRGGDLGAPWKANLLGTLAGGGSVAGNVAMGQGLGAGTGLGVTGAEAAATRLGVQGASDAMRSGAFKAIIDVAKRQKVEPDVVAKLISDAQDALVARGPQLAAAAESGAGQAAAGAAIAGASTVAQGEHDPLVIAKEMGKSAIQFGVMGTGFHALGAEAQFKAGYQIVKRSLAKAPDLAYQIAREGGPGEAPPTNAAPNDERKTGEDPLSRPSLPGAPIVPGTGLVRTGLEGATKPAAATPSPEPAPTPVAATAPPAGPRAYVPESSGLHVTEDQMLVRNITDGLARANPNAIDHAAPEMAARIPPNAILVPLPDHTGSTSANEQLAQAMAEHQPGADVQDVLSRTAQVGDSKALRDKGKPGVTADEHEASMAADLPEGGLPKGRPVVFVDNVETTGATAEGARRVLKTPDAQLVTYAKAPIPAGEQVATAPEERKFSSTQLDLPPETASAIKAVGAKIPDTDLAGDGRETAPHVTVKYGLHGSNPEAVRALLKDQPPITVTLGKTSVFPASESGNADVVKADVDSPALHALNKTIADALPNTDTHPEYVPHATIGGSVVLESYSGRGLVSANTNLPRSGDFNRTLGGRRLVGPSGRGAIRSEPAVREGEESAGRDDAGLHSSSGLQRRDAEGALAERGAEYGEGEQDEPLVGTKNAASAADRERFGLPERDTPDGRSFEEMYDAGKAAIGKDPNAITNLLDELRADPERVVSSDTEAGLMLAHRVGLENGLIRLSKAQDEARASGNAAAEKSIGVQLAAQRARIKDAIEINERSGTAAGRALVARKMMSKLNYSLGHLEYKLESAKGAPLSTKELDELKATHALLQQRLVALENNEADWRERTAKAEGDLAIAKLKLDVAGPIADRVTARLDKAADAAMARIRARGLRAMAGMDPEELADHAVIGAAALARGARTFAEWSKAMIDKMGKSVEPHLDEIFEASGKALDREIDREAPAPTKAEKPLGYVPKAKTPVDLRAKMRARAKKDGATIADMEPYLRKLAMEHIRAGVTGREALLDALHDDAKHAFPDVSRAEVRDALSGYGQFHPLNKEADATRLREVRGEMQKLAQLEALEKGEPPRATGFERQPPTDEARRLTQQVNEGKKRLGIGEDEEGHLKSALSAAKTRTRNTINDLQTEIDTGERIVKNKHVLIGDAELTALKEQLSDLRKIESDVFKKPGMTDEQRLALAIRLTKGNADAWAARLEKAKKGEFGVTTKAKLGGSPELDALRAKANAARREYEELKAVGDEPREIHPLRNPKARPAEGLGIEHSEEGPGLTGSAQESPSVADDLSPTSSAEIKKGAKDQHPDEVLRLRAEASNRAYRSRLAQREAEILDRIARNDYGPRPPKPSQKLDEESLKRQADVNAVKRELDSRVKEYERENRPAVTKAADYFAAWARGAVLTSTTVFEHLTGAAAARFVTTPLEQLVGYGLSKAMPRLAARAPRHGSPGIAGELRAEAAAQTRMWTEGLKGSWQELQNKPTTLDLVHGKPQAHTSFSGPKDFLETMRSEASPLRKAGKVASDAFSNVEALSEYMGHIHAAFKNPIFEAEYARSYQLRTEHALANGVNTMDPVEHIRLSNQAYVDALRSIMRQDNRGAQGYNSMLRRLESPSKKGGRPPLLGTVASATLRATMPIVKIPLNFAHEIAEASAGFPIGARRAFKAYQGEIDDLDNDEADQILRMMKKGLIGPALYALGFLLAAHGAVRIGGMFMKGQPKRKDADAETGSVGPISKDWLHSPYEEVFQMGASTQRVADSYLHKKDKEKQGLTAGMEAVFFGVMDMLPFSRGSSTLEALKDASTRDQTLNKFATNIAVPVGIQQLAKHGDTVQRKPVGLKQNLEAAIPGLRTNVPGPTFKQQKAIDRAKMRSHSIGSVLGPFPNPAIP